MRSLSDTPVKMAGKQRTRSDAGGGLCRRKADGLERSVVCVQACRAVHRRSELRITHGFFV